MKKTLFVLALLGFIFGAQAALTPGGWNPVVRERLDALIERNRGNPDAYAVFDFDYTTAMGDLSYVCMWHILERFAFQTDDYRAMLTVGVSPTLTTEANALADIAEKLKPLAGTDLTGNSEWQAFVRRYWKLYRNLSKEIGEYKAYLWRVSLFTGYTPEGLRALAREAIAQALASGVGLRRDANAPTEKRGLVITPEIKDLFGELRKAGIAVYIVSGSFTEVLKAATSPEFGLDLPPDNVFGCSLKRNASGRYLPEMAEGGVRYGRKPEFIRAHIAPRHHGAEPVLTAGDSMGDYAMLTEFKDLQLALVLRRNWNKPQMRELVERGGRVVAQGRDELRGCFIPTPESIEPKIETVQSPSSCRVVAWNVGHHARGIGARPTIPPGMDETYRREYREFIGDARVVGICEYSEEFSTNSPVRTVDALFSDYDVKLEGTRRFPQGNSLFFKNCRLIETKEREYPKRKRAKYYKFARVEMDGREVCVIETHLDFDTGPNDPLREARADQMRTIIADMANEKYVIICGDFNISSRPEDTKDHAVEYDVFAKAGYAMANRGQLMTWPSYRNPKCEQPLDNIIVKGFEISDVEVKSSERLSDHKMLSCNLRFLEDDAAGKPEIPNP